jgi:hypothetical protein
MQERGLIMPGIKLKLTQRELDLFMWFLVQTYPKGTLPRWQKLIAACLSEILLKLSTANVILKDHYQITISISNGIGLILHCENNKVPVPNQEAAIVVNKLIGYLDQKTA